MTIHHGLNGSQRVSVERPGHERVVYQRGRPGYVQHDYDFRGHEFAHRSYFYHGRAYSHFYYGYPYRGMYLNVYGPRYYYGPAFYGWAYNPWVSPVAYTWGWGAAPWVEFYGGYFVPYPTYASASFWLTDYMISTDLEAAYAAHRETGESSASSATAGPPALTPEVKQLVADEVNRDLAMENHEAALNTGNIGVDPGSTGIDHLLDDAAHGKQHVFVVGTALDVVDATNTECSLTEGDVLALRTAPASGDTTANLIVLSSKAAPECQKMATVSVKLDDLQEMENHLRETVDQGLQELQAKQGTGGLPAAPASARAKPVEAPYAAAAPAPDPDAAAQLAQQAQQATQAEQAVTAAPSQPAATR